MGVITPPEGSWGDPGVPQIPHRMDGMGAITALGGLWGDPKVPQIPLIIAGLIKWG